MKIPSKIKIGATWYKIIIAEEWLGGGDADGQTFTCKPQGNVIYIKESLTPEAKGVTLWHEILHCLNTSMNHEFLDSLAEQLYSVFTENKLLK